MELNANNYGPVLTELIARAGIKPRQASVKAGLGPNTVAFWVRMKFSPSLERLCWVLESLGYRLEVVKK